MASELTDRQRMAIDELIVEAQKLAVMGDNFAETITPRGAEQHGEALIQQAHVVRGIISRLPQPRSAWDGTLRDEHLEIEAFVPAARHGDAIGARVKHTITGIGRESSSKATHEENLRIARNALEGAVLERYNKMHQE